MRTRVAISVIAVAIGACGGTVVETTSTVGSSSSVVPETTTTVATTAPPATTSTTSTTSLAADTVEPLEIPRLDNGLPETFVGVTDDWEAVEVDTATGQVIRRIGLLERAGETDDEGAGLPAIQQVWRTSDHRWYVVSECCEPAAGMIHYLDPDTVLTEGNQYDNLISDGWTISPSPFDGRLAKLGYGVAVFAPDAEPEVEFELDEGNEISSLMAVPAWGREGASIWWLSLAWDSGTARLVHLDLGEPDAAPTAFDLGWLAPGQWLDGMGTQESGNLVAFLNTPNDDPEAPVLDRTEGVVFSTEGELLGTFPVETGSYWGGYDPSGRFLIYTDGENNVRWQGLGQSGILAEGFIHASW